MKRLLLCCTICLTFAATVQAAPLFELTFQDAGASVGDVFLNTTNAGSVVSNPAGVTWSDGEVLYTQGPGGAGDLAVQFIDKNVNHYLQRGGALEVYNWPIPTGSFTLMYAFRHDPADNHLQYDRIFDGWTGDGPTAYDKGPLMAWLNNANNVLFRSGHKDFTFTPTPGQWYHFAITFQYPSPSSPDRSYHKIYINGIQQFVNSSNYAYNVIDPAGIVKTVHFGADYRGYRPWSGAIDDVFYYEGLLTQDDIVAAYQASFTAPQSSDPVPEPASMGLVLIGLAGLKRYLRTRRAG